MHWTSLFKPFPTGISYPTASSILADAPAEGCSFAGAEYGTKAEAITAIVSEIDAYTTQHPVTNEPSVVHFYGFGASSLDIWVEIYFEYLEWDDFLRKRQEIMLGIMDIVEKHGGSFAFPSQTLYMRQDVPKEPTKKKVQTFLPIFTILKVNDAFIPVSVYRHLFSTAARSQF